MAEVKRKANAGERIKIVNAGFTFGDYANGTEMVVKKRAHDRAVYVKDYGVPNGVTIIADYEYVVLEPDEEPAPITLLPDEALGGTLREYREVKRKAAEGDRIKIVAAEWNTDYANGDVFTALEVDADNDVFFTDNAGDRECAYYREYSVLEPTDVIVIGAERLRMVDRKAAVGERVIVTENKSSDRRFKVGEVYTVIYVDDYEDRDVIVKHRDGTHSPSGGARLFDYAVLEPVESVDTTAAPVLLSAQPAEVQAAANIAALTLKVAELEKRNIALEGRILALETDSAPETVPTYTQFSVTPKVTPPQQIRDEIVERAKADIKDLRKFAGVKIPNDYVRFWPKTELPHDYSAMHTVKFVVNSAKRTVVTIIRCKYSGLTTRGIAKCAPGDVFNSHIGRVIALHRALGIAVPAEYLSVPQPEEVRVGDVVNSHSFLGVVTLVEKARGGTYNLAEKTLEIATFRVLSGTWIIDDSREDSGVTAASSPQKEAA